MIIHYIVLLLYIQVQRPCSYNIHFHQYTLQKNTDNPITLMKLSKALLKEMEIYLDK